MTEQQNNTFTDHLESIRLSWRLVSGLVLGSALMTVGSLYTIAAMAVTRLGGHPAPANVV